MKHNHQEAFCLMRYRSDDGTEEELIWNSRDGVTPFIITLRSGKFAKHIDWNDDLYMPDYQPKSGERIFVDLTPERAKSIAEENIAKWKAANLSLDYGPIPTVRDLVREYLRPGAPDIIEVP